MVTRKIGIIGCGHMGEALAGGLSRRVRNAARTLAVFDIDKRKSEKLRRRYGVSPAADSRQLTWQSDIVIIAVKPKDVPQLLGEIRPHLRGDKLLLSIAAGITTSRIEKAADMKIPVVRAMPNMAASIGESMTSLTAGRYAGRAHIRMARDIFSTIGEVVEVGENMVDAVTAVSGSGPAYFFYLVEILMEVAKELGLKRGVAEKLVLKTALASSRLLHLLGERPEVLRKKVTSKGGTTEAAFRVLESGGVKEIIKRAVRAAHGRSKELSES